MKRIEWLRDNYYILEDNIEHTYSTDFIMPMCGFVYSDFNLFNGEKVLNFLINCYIDNINKKIIISCDNDNLLISELDKYINSKYFTHTELHDNNKELLLYFDIPIKYIEDVELFLIGNYSRMSDEYKNILIRLYGQISNLENHQPTHFDVLYPSTTKKKLRAEQLGVDINLIKEVRSKPDLKYEIFTKSEDLQYIKTDRKILKEKYEHY